MFAVDERRIAHGEVHSFCLFASVDGGDGELRVTLVWTDPPASLPSAGRTLVNDLDLVVVNGDGGGGGSLGGRDGSNWRSG